MSLTYRLDVDDNGTVKIKKFSGTVGDAEQSVKQLDQRTSELSRDLARIKTDQLNNMRSGFANLISPVNLAVGAVLGASVAFTALAKEMLSTYDSAAELGRNTSIATSEILGLRYAAELSGIGTEAMDTALQKLTANIGKAAAGTGEAAPAFKEMGISLTNANGTLKNADQVLSEVADKFQGMGSAVDRGRLATELFGKSGVKMIELLKDGSAGLSSMTSEGALAAGNVENVSSLIEDFNDSMTRGKTVAMGLMAVLADTSPVEYLSSAVKDLSQQWMTFLSEREPAKQTEALQEQDKALQGVSNAAASLGAALGNASANQDSLRAAADRYQAAAKASGATELQIASYRLAGLHEAQDLIRTNTRISNEAKASRMAALDQEIQANLKLTTEARKRQQEEDAANAAKIKSEAEKQAALEKAHRDELQRQKDREAAEKEAAAAAKRRLEERKRLEESVLKSYEDLLARRRAAESSTNRQAVLDDMSRARGAKQISEVEYDQLNQLAERRTQMSLDNMSRYDREMAVAQTKHDQEVANLRMLQEVELSLATDKQATQSRHRNEIAQLDNSLITEQKKLKDEDDKRTKAAQKEELDRIAARRDAQLDAAAANAAAFQTLTKENKKFRVAYKAGAVTEAGINATQAVLKTMSGTPYPWNIPLAVMQGAAAAVEVNKIVNAKMYRGGMIQGKNSLILANEDGTEALLNTAGVRAVGGAAGVNALNSSQYNYATNYNTSQQKNITLNVGMLSQKTLYDDVIPAIENANYRY